MNCTEYYEAFSYGVKTEFCFVGNEEIALFLLQNGAGFSSYTLLDHPAFSKRLLRVKLQENYNAEGDKVALLI